MSRIGKLKIPVPAGVTVDIKSHHVAVKGKLGQLEIDVDSRITVAQEDGEVSVTRSCDERQDKALHGLTRALIANMVEGVSNGFTRGLEIHGTGYRVEQKGDVIVLNVGYSNPVEFKVPADIKAEVEPKKNLITLTGIDKQRIGQVSADLRNVRPPDVYKGKGIRYKDENVRLKEGKKGV